MNSSSSTPTGGVLHDFYRLPQGGPGFTTAPNLSSTPSLFRFGPDVVCYGRFAGMHSSGSAGLRYESLPARIHGPDTIELPFDAVRVIDDLRNEKYAAAENGTGPKSWAASTISHAYYALRPAMPVWCRKHLQRARLRGWENIPFPRWPVDTSVEDLLQALLQLFMRAAAVDRVPFIWFWPDGLPSCAIVTHDVETRAGLDFCPTLMRVNDSFSIKSSFQIIPEKRYRISQAEVDSFRKAGFELNVHDFNHDGYLFRSKSRFRRRAPKINSFATSLGAAGFRSAALYRKQEWLRDLNFVYDMSVPNVGHLDPQRGGCCTVFPYFIGQMLELPLTTIQDYSLFHILSEYSIDLWKRQVAVISARHGLATFLIHPDYVTTEREMGVYKSLLEYLSGLRADHRLWIARPREAAEWWKQRSRMILSRKGDLWEVTGPGSEHARVAYARLAGGNIEYELENRSLSARHD